MSSHYGTISLRVFIDSDRETAHDHLQELVNQLNERCDLKAYEGAVLLNVRTDEDAEREWEGALHYRGISPPLAKLSGVLGPELDEGERASEIRRDAPVVEWNRRVREGTIPQELLDRVMKDELTSDAVLETLGWKNPY